MTSTCTRCHKRPPGTPRWEAERGLCHACYIALGKVGQLSNLPLQRATMGVRRDCACKQAKHRHGTYTAYTVDRCRCNPCRDANTAYMRERTRLAAERAWGIDQPATPSDLVDAEPARRHLQQLLAAGMGLKTIATKGGIGHGSISSILYGKPARDPRERRPPRRRITRDLEARILAVHLDLADGARIPAVGAQRRLQALVAIGWSQAALGRRLGINPANINQMMRKRHLIQVSTRKAVIALYDELWNQQPPTDTPRRRQSATRARRFATQHGWAPPLAWDDDTIDDPDSAPAITLIGRATAVDRLEDVEFLLDDGQTQAAILTRLGVTRSAIEQACARSGRRDLLDRFLAAGKERVLDGTRGQIRRTA